MLFAVANPVVSGVVGIFIGIASLFYSILENLVDLFSELTLLQLVSGDMARTIYQRIGLVITLFMLLKLTVTAIQMIVDPDIITDKEKGVGKILKRIIVAVFLLGITPYLFKGAMELQKVVVNSQVIPRVVIGEEIDISNFGRDFSSTLFTNTIDDKADAKIFKEDLMFDDETKYSDGADYFDSVGSSFMCLVIGGFACWMFLSYSISLALRLVQLLFLQVIAPIPIISSISSKKDTALNVWAKQCLSTYLDVFIRMFIIYLIILVEKIIMSGSIVKLDGTATDSSVLVVILLMLGALLFAKKVPELIEELFPSLKTKASLGYGFDAKSGAGSFARRGVNAAAGGIVGGVVGAVGGRGVGRLTGFAGGLLGGTANGLFGKDKGVTSNIRDAANKQYARNMKLLGYASNGSTFGGRMNQRLSNFLGMEGLAERFETQLAELESGPNGLTSLKQRRTAYDGFIKTKKDLKNQILDDFINKSAGFHSDPNDKIGIARRNFLNMHAEYERKKAAGTLTAQDTLNYNTAQDNAFDAVIDAMRSADYGTAGGTAREGGYDDKMTRLLTYINTNPELFDNVVDSNGNVIHNVTGSSSLSLFDKAAKSRNNDLTSEIQSREEAIAKIKDSDEYKKAQADRNAVGGGSGKR